MTVFIPNHLHQKVSSGQEKVLPYMQWTLHLTDLLLAYADREVHCHLRRKKVQIESYAASWTSTMFSRVINLSMLYELWEVFLFERDQFFLFYFSVALIRHHRQKILATQQVSQLITLMAHLTIDSYQSLAEVYRLAIEVRQRTPVSF